MIKKTISILMLFLLMPMLILAIDNTQNTGTPELYRGDVLEVQYTFVNTESETINNIQFSVSNITGPENGELFEESDFRIYYPSTSLSAGENQTVNFTINAQNNPAVGNHEVDIDVQYVIPESNNKYDREEITKLFKAVDIKILNHAPVLDEVQDITYLVDNPNELPTITATDADGDLDNLTFSLENAPTGLMIDSETGELYWNPAPTQPFDAVTVTVKVTDDYDTDSDTFTIEAVNEEEITITEPNFGSDDQERETTITDNLEIINSGAEDLTVTLDKTLIDSEYYFNFTGYETQNTISFTVQAGQTMYVPVEFYIPLDQDSGKHSIGDVIATYESRASENVPVYVETESYLDFDDVYVIIDGDDEQVSSGENIDIKAQDEFDLELTIENLNDDYDFEDGDIEIEVESSELDIDESETYDDDLDHDDTSDEITFKNLEIDEDDENDDVDVVITLTGVDENGAEHTAEFIFQFDIKEIDEVIEINSVSLSSTRVLPGTDVEFEVELENIGSEDNDDVYLRVKNVELGIDEVIGAFEIEEDDEETKTILITIPEDAVPKIYSFDVKAYYDNDESDLSDVREVDLTVYTLDNTDDEEDDEDDSSNVNIITDQPSTPNNAQYGEPIQSNSLFGSDNSILIILIVLLIVIIGVLVVILLPSKK
jgi:hypothetical protein